MIEDVGVVEAFFFGDGNEIAAEAHHRVGPDLDVKVGCPGFDCGL